MQCPKCYREYKTIEEGFFRDKKLNAGYDLSSCKACHADYQRGRRKAVKDSYDDEPINDERVARMKAEIKAKNMAKLRGEYEPD
jgi:hypothetical protein